MNIFIFRDNQQYGPYSESDIKKFLKEGTLSKNDLMWKEGMLDWVPLTELEEEPPRPHVAPDNKQAVDSERVSNAGTMLDKIRLKWALGITFTLVFVILLVLIRPAQKSHNPNEAANALFVQATDFFQKAAELDDKAESAYPLARNGFENIDKIVQNHPQSDIAVKLAQGEFAISGEPFNLKYERQKFKSLERRYTAVTSSPSKLCLMVAQYLKRPGQGLIAWVTAGEGPEVASNIANRLEGRERANALAAIAIELYASGDALRAKEAWSKALSAFEEESFPKYMQDMLIACLKIFLASSRLGDEAEAKNALSKAFFAVEKFSPDYDVPLLLKEIFDRLMPDNKLVAEEFFPRVLATIEKLSGKEKIKALVRSATTLIQHGDVVRAKRLFSNALVEIEKLEDFQKVEVIPKVAHLSVKLGDNAKGLDLLRRALAYSSGSNLSLEGKRDALEAIATYGVGILPKDQIIEIAKTSLRYGKDRRAPHMFFHLAFEVARTGDIQGANDVASLLNSAQDRADAYEMIAGGLYESGRLEGANEAWNAAQRSMREGTLYTSYLDTVLSGMLKSGSTKEALALADWIHRADSEGSNWDCSRAISELLRFGNKEWPIVLVEKLARQKNYSLRDGCSALEEIALTLSGPPPGFGRLDNYVWQNLSDGPHQGSGRQQTIKAGFAPEDKPLVNRLVKLLE